MCTALHKKLDVAEDYLKKWFADNKAKFKDNNDIINEIKEAKIRLTEKRALKIAIAGRMNTGKSMLVDNLFFEGKGVVNSCETPSTARLTTLCHSDDEHGEITFINQEDIDILKELSKRYTDEGEEYYKFAYNLIQDINSSKEANSNMLGAKIRVPSYELKEYSDAGGKYTPFVKSINIYLREEILKSIEIIDTPGLGDPIVSREKITNDKICEVDIIIYLSAAEQFMDEEDIKYYLFLKGLGIDNIIILASRFDEILQEKDFDGCNIEQSKTFLEIKSGFISRLERKLQEDNYNKKFAYSAESLCIYPSSPLITKIKYSLEKSYPLTEDEKVEMEFNRSRYEDELGISFSDNSAYHISGILKIKNKLKDFEEQKNKIIFELNKGKALRCILLIKDLYKKDLEELKFKEASLKIRLDTPSDIEMIKTEVKTYQEKCKTAFMNAALDAKEQKIEPKWRKFKEVVVSYIETAKLQIEKSASSIDIRRAVETLGKSMVDVFEISVDEYFDIIGGKLYIEVIAYYKNLLAPIKLNDTSLRIKQQVEEILTDLKEGLYAELREQQANKFGRQIHEDLNSEEINKRKKELYEDISKRSQKFKKVKKSTEVHNTNIKVQCKNEVDLFALDIYKRINRLYELEINKVFQSINNDMGAMLEGKLKTLFSILTMDNQNAIEEDLNKIKNAIFSINDILNEMDSIESEVQLHGQY